MSTDRYNKKDVNITYVDQSEMKTRWKEKEGKKMENMLADIVKNHWNKKSDKKKLKTLYILIQN